MVIQKEYYFNNWMTLLSQLPLLLFTLLNSFLYPRSVTGLEVLVSELFIRSSIYPLCVVCVTLCCTKTFLSSVTCRI